MNGARKGVPGIEAVTRGRGGGGLGVLKKNLVVIFPKSIFKTTSNGVTHLQALES